MVVLSSASTGKPKLILHDLYSYLKSIHKSKISKRILCSLAMDHIGGLNTLLQGIISGHTFVASTNNDPVTISDLIIREGVQILICSPTLLRFMVLSASLNDLSKSKAFSVINCGGEPLPSAIVDKINKVLPNVNIQDAYGLTEAGLIASSQNDKILRVHGDFSRIRIYNGTLEILAPQSLIGYLGMSPGYCRKDWIKTGDKATYVNSGIKITGRANNVINIGGEKVSPEVIENVILSVDGVLDVLVSAKHHDALGTIIVAIIKKDDKKCKDMLQVAVWNVCKSMLKSFEMPHMLKFENSIQYTKRQKKVRNSLTKPV